MHVCVYVCMYVCVCDIVLHGAIGHYMVPPQTGATPSNDGACLCFHIVLHGDITCSVAQHGGLW